MKCPICQSKIEDPLAEECPYCKVKFDDVEEKEEYKSSAKSNADTLRTLTNIFIVITVIASLYMFIQNISLTSFIYLVISIFANAFIYYFMLTVIDIYNLLRKK